MKKLYLFTFTIGFISAIMFFSQPKFLNKQHDVKYPLGLPYYNEFRTTFPKEPITFRSLKVEFKDESAMPFVFNKNTGKNRRAHGHCDAHKLIKRYYIAINKQHWDTINNFQKRELLFHEYAHCLLGMGHVDRDMEIMNPQSPNVYWVKPDGSNWNLLIMNLKQQRKNGE